MKLRRFMGICFGLAVTAGTPDPILAAESSTYREICEASAAVALGRDYFVVASDETNKVRVYKRGQPIPVGALDLAQFLDTKPGKGSDLEGAATIGTRVYWISSHSRNKDGEVNERRMRFFATEMELGSPPSIKPVGTPYTKLLDDMVSAPQLASLNLSDAIRRKPEDREGGLNIEGLSATPAGDLLIGFRNPIPARLAILVPLKNPKDLIKGKKAKFGLPIQLDLKGRGIRSIDLVGSSYLIVAGPPDNSGSFALFRWSGVIGQPPKELAEIDFGDLHPEAMFALPQSSQVQILSDDGGVQSAGVNCADGASESDQAFRSITRDFR